MNHLISLTFHAQPQRQLLALCLCILAAVSKRLLWNDQPIFGICSDLCLVYSANRFRLQHVCWLRKAVRGPTVMCADNILKPMYRAQSLGPLELERACSFHAKSGCNCFWLFLACIYCTLPDQLILSDQNRHTAELLDAHVISITSSICECHC